MLATRTIKYLPRGFSLAVPSAALTEVEDKLEYPFDRLLRKARRHAKRDFFAKDTHESLKAFPAAGLQGLLLREQRFLHHLAKKAKAPAAERGEDVSSSDESVESGEWSQEYDYGHGWHWVKRVTNRDLQRRETTDIFQDFWKFNLKQRMYLFLSNLPQPVLIFQPQSIRPLRTSYGSSTRTRLCSTVRTRVSSDGSRASIWFLTGSEIAEYQDVRWESYAGYGGRPNKSLPPTTPAYSDFMEFVVPYVTSFDAGNAIGALETRVKPEPEARAEALGFRRMEIDSPASASIGNSSGDEVDDDTPGHLKEAVAEGDKDESDEEKLVWPPEFSLRESALSFQILEALSLEVRRVQYVVK